MAKKKSKPTNLVLPILLVSTVVSILYLTYLNLPKASPVGINEVGSGSTANCASVAFTDNFTGTNLESTRWDTYSETGGTATINDSLTLSVPSNQIKTWGSSGIFSGKKVEIEGDFILEATLTSLSTSPAISTDSSVFLGVYQQDWQSFYRIEIYKNGDIQSNANNNGITTIGTSINAYKNTPTKLKLVRIGNQLTTYYDTGAGYTQHTRFNDVYTGRMSIELTALSTQPERPAVTATYQNVSLKCRPPKPTNLSSTCAPDGKSVIFKWDDNSPSKKYSFALNDPSDDTSASWYKPGTTEVWRGGDYNTNTYTLPVIPGKKYRWWVITNVNGPSSDQSDETSASFTCQPTVIAPTNLRSTCAPDGKSARLTWDGIVDAESYKVRFDDKAGHVAYYDNLKQTQYIVNTVPGKNYSFWVHSHKGDVDSNQSTAVDFTCQATSTPTPRPSVKASPTPTRTPEISPISIASPTPDATTTITNSYAMSPRATQNTAINTEPTTIESTPTSTNPLYRFFSWIAGLFK